MAIIKRGKKFQVKRRIGDAWVTKTFGSYKEAECYQATLLTRSPSGGSSFEAYFEQWWQRRRTTQAWQRNQRDIYRLYIEAVLRGKRLVEITPADIVAVLNGMADKGKSAQLRLHAYNLLRKCFGEAVSLDKVLLDSPVLPTFRPKVVVQEAAFLTRFEAQTLLYSFRGERYEIAVWLGVVLGLRVGEIQELRWGDVNLDAGMLVIRRAYSNAENTVRNSPKGKLHHRVHLPQELVALLRDTDKANELVAAPRGWKRLDYWAFRRVLRQRCKELGIRSIATHGLRHTSSELWMDAGAKPEDVRALLAHKDIRTTDRYLHGRGKKLKAISERVFLFPKCSQPKSEQALSN